MPDRSEFWANRRYSTAASRSTPICGLSGKPLWGMEALAVPMAQVGYQISPTTNKMTIPANPVDFHLQANILFRGLRSGGLVGDMDNFGIGRNVAWPGKAHAEHRQNKQRQQRRADEAADHDSRQRLLHLGAGAGRESHRHEAQRS